MHCNVDAPKIMLLTPPSALPKFIPEVVAKKIGMCMGASAEPELMWKFKKLLTLIKMDIIHSVGGEDDSSHNLNSFYSRRVMAEEEESPR